LKKIIKFRDEGCRFFLRLDVRDYDGTIDHDILLDRLHEAIGSSVDQNEWQDIDTVLREYMRVTGDVLGTTGKGMLGGSLLTGLLNNLYLVPVDKELRSRGLRFVRAGDDYVVASMARIPDDVSEALDAALDALKLRKHEHKSKQCCLDTDMTLQSYWDPVGRYGAAHTESQCSETTFDFCGVLFVGKESCIRSETLAKIQNRVSRITYLSFPTLNNHSSEFRQKGLEKAIRRINHRLGYPSPCERASAPQPSIRFYPRGWASIVIRLLALTGGRNEALLDQCRSLDSYIRGRLCRWVGFDRRTATSDDLRQFNSRLRQMDLRGFVDVYNRFSTQQEGSVPTD